MARGNPSHRRHAHSGNGGAVPEGDGIEALMADLDALRGVTEDEPGIRPDHHRSLGRRKDQREYLFGPPGRWPKFDGFRKVSRRARIRRTRKTRAEAQAARRRRRGDAEILGDQTGAALHRGRRPASTRLLSSKELEFNGWEAVPYAPSCRPFRNANMSPKREAVYPTELGRVVTELLLESFRYIFDVQYTARMEEELTRSISKLELASGHGRVLRQVRPRT